MAINRNNGGLIGKANKTSNGGNVVTTFTASGTFTASNNTNEVDVLVLAGGGSGGASTSGSIMAGGGGAGGFQDIKRQKINPGDSFAVTVGAGGAASPAPSSSDVQGNDGSNSVWANPVSPITSTGGGGGGGGEDNSYDDGRPGGSGGGAAYAYNAGSVKGDGTAGQGNDGGASSLTVGGGGGGAGATGVAGGTGTSPDAGGDGGVGAPSTITNQARMYAGGGAGASYGKGTGTSAPAGGAGAQMYHGQGGAGGGGFGNHAPHPSAHPTGGASGAGEAQTGGGGGGGAGVAPGSVGADGTGAAGGSGIVIVKENNKATGVFNMNSQYNSNRANQWPSEQTYQVSNSLMLNTGDSAYLNFNKTHGSAGLTKYTISAWCKLSQGFGSSSRWLFGAGSASGDNDYVLWTSNDVLKHSFDTEGSGNIQWAAKFRDPAAWSHIVIAVDTTQATAAERVKAYANGVVLSTSSATYPSQNYVTSFGKGQIDHRIGARAYSATGHYGGYISEFNFIAGQALGPGHFGQVDPDSPNTWIPKKYNGAYGNMGAYLEFKQSGVGTGSASTIGADTSGNTNHYTSTNVATTDQMTDTCTNNFCTMNPIDVGQGHSTLTFSEGSLKIVKSTTESNPGEGDRVGSSIGLTTGKWYWEEKLTTNADGNFNGIFNDHLGGEGLYHDNYAYTYYPEGNSSNSQIYRRIEDDQLGYGVSDSDSWSDGAIKMCALDLDNGKWYIGRNGSWTNNNNASGGTATSGSAFNQNAIAGFFSIPSAANGGFWRVLFSPSGGTAANTTEFNFGSPAFAISSGNADANGHGNFEYAVPSGFYSICTKNLAQYG